MSDYDNLTHEKPFSVEIAKQGRAICKKCKQKCTQGDLRIAKLIPNPLGSGKMKTWHHVNCIFEVFLKQRQTTKRIEGPYDVEGWESLKNDDKTDILKKIKECNKAFEAKLHKSAKKSKRTSNKSKSQVSYLLHNEDSLSVSSDSMIKEDVHKDNCFYQFRAIVANVSNASSSNEKIGIFRNTFTKGSDGTGFKGDIFLWCKLLLPSIVKRVYHLQTKQLVKIFGKIFQVTEPAVMAHLDHGDVGRTIQFFFEQNKDIKPAKKSTLTLYEIDEFLDTLTNLSKEEDQYNHFKTFIKRCTSNDLKVVIRLIKHDLRMNAGAKHVFGGIHPDAYLIFQSCRDVKTVINTCWGSPLKKDTSQNEVPSPKTPRRSPKRKASSSDTKTNKKSRFEDIKEEVKDVEKTEAKVEKVEPEIVKTESEISENNRTSIPNYFENIKLYLEEGVTERHAEWIRYFIAYGGTVLKPDEHEEATHVLHLKDTVGEPTIQCVNSARHVIVEWIKDTVEKEVLQDYRPYTVRWKPRKN